MHGAFTRGTPAPTRTSWWPGSRCAESRWPAPAGCCAEPPHRAAPFPPGARPGARPARAHVGRRGRRTLPAAWLCSDRSRRSSTVQLMRPARRQGLQATGLAWGPWAGATAPLACAPMPARRGRSGWASSLKAHHVSAAEAWQRYLTEREEFRPCHLMASAAAVPVPPWPLVMQPQAASSTAPASRQKPGLQQEVSTEAATAFRFRGRHK